MDERAERWLLVAVLLVAGAIRLYGLNNLSPPGLAHDEVANWLIDRSILAGNHAIYFTEAYGHEAGFHYLQTLFVALVGNHALALRLPAAFAGLMGVAATYTLGRHLFERKVAFTAAALLAVLFWPVFYSRLGLRAISLPLLSGLSAIFWWRGWQARRKVQGAPVEAQPGAAWRWFVLSGLFAGLSLHTYMAARVVPLFYASFLLYLALFHRAALRARGRNIILFAVVFLLVAAPLALFLATHPGAEYRIGEIDAPLRALLQGDLRPAVDNVVDILAMFGVRGDPLWRQNVALRPVFDPVTAVFFYACLLLCLLRVRNARYAFLLLWTLTAFIPSILTIDAPSSIRIINILPVLTLLPAIIIHNLGHLSTEKAYLSTALMEKWIPALLVLLLFLWHLGRTGEAIFVIWPANEEVQFVWQKALTEAAAYLDATPQTGAVAIGGWTPATMDPPTMALTLRRDDLQLRFFDPQQALILPAGSALGNPVRLIHPTILPPHPALQAELQRWGAVPMATGDFTLYTLREVEPSGLDFSGGVTFGGEITLLGSRFTEDCRPFISLPCQVITYWQVMESPQTPRRFFLHVVDGQGNTVTQHDGLGAPAAHWQPGDLILQRHELAVEMPAPYTLRLGVYDPLTGRRLLTATGVDYVLLMQDEPE